MSKEQWKYITAALSVVGVSIAAVAVVLSQRTFTSATIAPQDVWYLDLTFLMAAAAFLGVLVATVNIYVTWRFAAQRDSKQVFIVYAREDVEEAKKIASALSGAGLKPWLDVQELDPGRIWRKTALKELERSTAAVVLVSEHLSESKFSMEEAEMALKTIKQKNEHISSVIPVVIDKSNIPKKLSHIQWADFGKSGTEAIVRSVERATNT